MNKKAKPKKTEKRTVSRLKRNEARARGELRDPAKMTMDVKRRGPKYTEIPQQTFEGLCAIQCTEMEVCQFFEVDSMTLESWCERTYGRKFSEIYDQKRGQGKVSLRRAMYRNAVENMNPALQIFIAKNHLGMADKKEITHKDLAVYFDEDDPGLNDDDIA